MDNIIMTNNNNDHGKEDFREEIENLLRNNASRSYSKEEIINLIASDSSTQEIEKTLGEIEIWGSMKDVQSSIYSSCKGGTVYFQWGQSP